MKLHLKIESKSKLLTFTSTIVNGDIIQAPNMKPNNSRRAIITSDMNKHILTTAFKPAI